MHAEIPFKDAPEAVYVETVTGNKGFINSENWINKRPYMLMIDINDWSKIKKSWLNACRINKDKCNITVKSIDKIVRNLDEIIKRVIK